MGFIIARRKRTARPITPERLAQVRAYVDEHRTTPGTPAEPSAELARAPLAPLAPCMPQAAPRPVCPGEAPRAARAPRGLAEVVAHVDESFSQTLLRHIDARGLRDPEVYRRAHIDRKLFSKIRRDQQYRPSKSTALALAVALELNLDELRDLIGRAGYALTHASEADLIVEYFVTEGIYDLFEINAALYAFGQPPLGC